MELISVALDRSAGPATVELKVRGVLDYAPLVPTLYTVQGFDLLTIICPPAVLESVLAKHDAKMSSPTLPGPINNAFEVDAPSVPTAQGNPGCHCKISQWDINLYMSE
jgi:hypothetical protein